MFLSVLCYYQQKLKTFFSGMGTVFLISCFLLGGGGGGGGEGVVKNKQISFHVL